MDAHLVVIDLGRLLLKQSSRREKQPPAKVESAVAQAMAEKESRTQAR
jgi:hypothetical protein